MEMQKFPMISYNDILKYPMEVFTAGKNYLAYQKKSRNSAYVEEEHPSNMSLLGTGSVLEFVSEDQTKQPGKCIDWFFAKQ